MEYKGYCQSCSMPLDKTDLKGTEKDGSISDLYCRYCYNNGVFTNPGLTLDKMRSRVVSEAGKKQLPAHVLEDALVRLPHLFRWKRKSKEEKKPALPQEVAEPAEKLPLQAAPTPGPLAGTEQELDRISGEDEIDYQRDDYSGY